MDDKTIGLRLKELRKYKGFSQLEMAEFLDVKQPHLSELERGARGVTLLVFRKIYKKWASVNFNWLITGEGPMLLDHTETTGEVNEPNQTYDPVSKEEKERLAAVEAAVRELRAELEALKKEKPRESRGEKGEKKDV